MGYVNSISYSIALEEPIWAWYWLNIVLYYCSIHQCAHCYLHHFSLLLIQPDGHFVNVCRWGLNMRKCLSSSLFMALRLHIVITNTNNQYTYHVGSQWYCLISLHCACTDVPSKVEYVQLSMVQYTNMHHYATVNKMVNKASTHCLVHCVVVLKALS